MNVMNHSKLHVFVERYLNPSTLASRPSGVVLNISRVANCHLTYILHSFLVSVLSHFLINVGVVEIKT